MDIHSVRQLVRRKSIYEIPLRVTFYARVSSESDEQLNSLDNQISYYEDLIRKNPAWTFLPGYIDEGISGMSTEKRENFTGWSMMPRLGCSISSSPRKSPALPEIPWIPSSLRERF